MNTGRNVLFGFEHKGVHYDLVAVKDPSFVVTWYIRLFEGADTWKNESIIGDPVTVIAENVISGETAQMKVQVAVNQINEFLKKRFDTELSWVEQIELWILRIVFFLDGAMPQVKLA